LQEGILDKKNSRYALVLYQVKSLTNTFVSQGSTWEGMIEGKDCTGTNSTELGPERDPFFAQLHYGAERLERMTEVFEKVADLTEDDGQKFAAEVSRMVMTKAH
jgi:hypothetical protein